LALITAVIQFVAALCAPVIKIAQPFASPALLLSVFLGVGTVLLFRRMFVAWIAATALASIALLTSALSFAIGNVEAKSSARPVAKRLLELQQPGESLLGAKFLVRGIFF